MNSSSSALISDTGLSTEEITRASRHLTVTRAFLLESVSGLSAAQWNFKPGRDNWSIAEITEHLVLIEGRVHAIIGNMSNAPEPESGREPSEMDDFIVSEIPKRSIKLKAPKPVCPEGRASGIEALQSFTASREKTMHLLAAPLLRGRVVRHPFFGPWDGYQWLMGLASHTARHADQIHEVKANPNFPQP